MKAEKQHDSIYEVVIMFFSINLQPAFSGVVGKKPPAQIGSILCGILCFYIGYIHRFMECSFHRSLITSKQTIGKSLDYMVSCLFVSML
jgi:hypothetical protein